MVLQLDGLKSGTEYEFYCYVEAGGMRYNSPVVTFRTTGTPSDDPDPDDPQAEEPRFGTPSFTEVGSSSAQLSCTYTYAGTESVSEAGFYYHTSGSTAEQKVAAAGRRRSPPRHRARAEARRPSSRDGPSCWPRMTRTATTTMPTTSVPT